jgi:hypothetical protein
MKQLKLFTLFAFFTVFIFQNIEGQEWPKIYGDNIHAYINKIIEDYDEGLLLCGSVLSNPNTFKYAWIIKTDINGNVIWDKKFHKGTSQFYLNSSCKTFDEGMVMCGASASIDSQFDPVFFNLNVCSESQWCTILYSSGYNIAEDIISVSDGYIGLLAYFGEGQQYSRSSLVKMNLAGEPLWIQNLAQNDTLINDDEIDKLYLTNDQNYVVSGQCFHPGLQPVWIKTDTSGLQIWDLFWPGGLGTAYQLAEADYGIFFSAGSFAEPGMYFYPTIYQFDNEGNPINKKYILSDTINGGEARSVCSYTDNNILAGVIWGTNTNRVSYKSEIFLLDTAGNILDRKLLLNETRPPTYISKTNDDKILVTGCYVVDSNWDIYLWKLNADLEIDTLYTQPLTYDSLCPYEIQSDTVDLDCGVFVNIDEVPTKEEYESTIKIYPNPAREWAVLTLPDVVAEGKVELVVYDIFGREVGTGGQGDRETRRPGEYLPANRMLLLDVASYPAGMYVAVAVDRKGRRYTGKFVVAK